jgi:hypothetical protein
MIGEQAANKALPSADGDAGCTVLKTGRLPADFRIEFQGPDALRKFPSRHRLAAEGLPLLLLVHALQPFFL